MALAIMAPIGEEGQAQLAALRHSEAAARLHQGAGGKAGGDRARVLLLGLGDPPSQQVALLVLSLRMHMTA